MERDFKGVFIPKEIWLNDELSITEKAIFAEIDSLDGEKGCYASNEYLSNFCKVSESTITKTISKLKSLGLLKSESFDGRTRVLRVVKFTTLPSKIYYADCQKNCVSSIKEKIKEDIVEKQATPAHPRNFKSQQNTLVDDLSSEIEIQAQKKERKKQSEYDKCISHIDSLEYDDNVKDLLRRFFEKSYSSRATERISNLKSLQSRLKKLSKLSANGEDIIKIIEQSIENEWHSFWEVKDNLPKKKSYEGLSDNVDSNLSSDERKRIMEEKMKLVAEGKAKVY